MVWSLQSVSPFPLFQLIALMVDRQLDANLFSHSLAPKYEELGALYFNNPEFADKVTIAKVDATANDVPEQIQGFPTIKLYPAGKKSEPVDYNGSRTIEDLAKFIHENGAHAIEVKVEPAKSEDDDQEEEEEETVSEKAESAADKVEEKVEEKTEGIKEAVKSKVSEAAEAVKTAVSDSDDIGEHDEL